MHMAHDKVSMKSELELVQLEQFVTLARTGNFTRAAEKLSLAQAALSRAIQRLEDRIGQPVFERKPREVVLTDLGKILLERARAILHLVEDTMTMLSESDRYGKIRLGAIPTIAPYFLPGVLSEFSESHPNISVIVQEDTTENLIKRCSHGEIDLAILAYPINAKYLETEALFDEELFLVVPPEHELAARKKVEASVVEEYPFVTLNEAHCLAENINSFCRNQSVQPVSVERISQLATVQELVALDHGVSIIPAMARDLDGSDRRVYRSFSGEKPSRTILMMWNPHRYESKWIQALKQYLRTSCS